MEALKQLDMAVICGHRGEAEQEKAYKEGKSKVQWPRSMHNHLPSLAVDLVPYPLKWNDEKSFQTMGAVVKEAAARLKIPIQWGGDWTTFKDMPHFELKSINDVVAVKAQEVA
jgi:hypothetical protein